MKKSSMLFILLFSILSMTACDKNTKPKDASELEKTIQEELRDDADKSEKKVLTPITEAAWVDANNTFALKLLRYEAVDASVVASPFSIERALGMTLDGAVGKTAQEMRTALALPEAAELSAAGAKVEAKILKTFSDDDAVVMRVVNRLWLEKTYALDTDFLAQMKRDYWAEPTLLDFRTRAEASRLTINSAIAEVTNDKIVNLIPSGVIGAATRLVLTNAVYFKSPWAASFQKEATEEAEFASPKGPVTVDMMHMTKRLPLYKGTGFSALTLAYAGSRHALVILLPDAHEIDALAKLEAQLDAQKLRDIFEKSEQTRVSVALPRFKVEKDLSLKEVLERLGMSAAFSPSEADFSKMTTGDDLFISEALHKAIIEVDEDGTEAAAATALVMAMSMPMPETEEPLPFVADHPFTFMLIDGDSKAIVFVGRFVGDESTSIPSKSS